MKSDPASAPKSWFPVFKIVIELAALGLCSWAMSAERNRGRVLTGGTTPPDAAKPASP
jgi:hypothetical protein